MGRRQIKTPTRIVKLSLFEKGRKKIDIQKDMQYALFKAFYKGNNEFNYDILKYMFETEVKKRRASTLKASIRLTLETNKSLLTDKLRILRDAKLIEEVPHNSKHCKLTGLGRHFVRSMEEMKNLLEPYIIEQKRGEFYENRRNWKSANQYKCGTPLLATADSRLHA